MCKSRLHVRFYQGAMKKLEVLKAYCCDDSELHLSGIEHPVSLQQVWLLGSYGDILKERVQKKLARHPKNPAFEEC